jgi:signal transduction histidine kinase
MRASRSLRQRVSAAATGTLAVWVAFVTLVFNLILTNRLHAQADGVLRLRAQAAASTLDVNGAGGVIVHDARDDASIDVGTWIYADSKLVEGPSAGSGLDGHAAVLSRHPGQYVDVGQQTPVRLYAYPVTSGRQRIATIVTSLAMDPYEETSNEVLIASGALGVLLLLGAFLVLRSSVSRSLSPVQAMTRQAQEWSTGDTERRFGDEDRPRELAVLARTLDGLLSRLAAVLRHEKQLVAELSHELRTPLSRIAAEVSLLQERRPSDAELAEAQESIARNAAEMGQILETLLTTARTETGAPAGRCDALEVARALVGRLQTGRDQPPQVLVQTTTQNTYAGVDPPVLARALAPVLENALRYASAEIKVRIGRRLDVIVVDVLDDGPGIPADCVDRVFEPGQRLDPADGHDGAGLGLALARRLLTAAGGTITVEPAEKGASVRLLVPSG